MSPNGIASAVILQYNKLPKKGKPNLESEWTTMAAIVQEDISITNDSPLETSSLKVVSIGTGTKCLGKSELSGNGDMVSDSHAEVIARRSFLLYLYEQVELCKTGRENKSILVFSDSSDKNVIGNLKVRKGIRFHMFVSQLPCGDSAIIDKVISKAGDDESSPPPAKKAKSEDCQEHRTGAKLQVGPLQYEETQATGKCRVKPGKGDPTLSMSCSDKIAKWQILGLQGSLLSVFITEPIRLKSIVIGGNVSFDKACIERALFSRFSTLIEETIKDSPLLNGYECPEIFQCELNFMEFKDKITNPAPASISWYFSLAVLDLREAVQVLVGGRKQGATKKFFGKPSSMVDICRAKLFARFKRMYSGNDKLENYNDAKNLAVEYASTWTKLKANVFTGWTDKPEQLKLFN